MGWWGGRGRIGALGLIMVLDPGRGRRDGEEGWVAGRVVRHGPPGTLARLATNGVGGAGWVRGGPLTEFRRRRRILPLPQERVKSGAACM